MARWLSLFGSLSLLAVACGGDGDARPDGAGPPDADLADGGLGPDAGGCAPLDLLPPDWRPVDAVSPGAISSSTAGGVTTALVDATAGGSMGIGDDPFVYLDLATGAKVDVTDVASYTADTWDLALKRMVIRTNGGDSGAACVEVAAVPAATLAEVTQAPPASAFASDDWADGCTFAPGALGEPYTVFGAWYSYDSATHVLTPQPTVYVVRTRAGALVKLRVDSYYADPANPMRGAYYRLEWAPL